MARSSPHRRRIRGALGMSLGLGMIAALGACTEKPPPGFIRVVAPSEGVYEIYRIASEAPLQFISEQIGQFNQDLALAPGSYLILADCSSKTVIIRAGSTETLVAHDVKFIPPHEPGRDDKFSIQCNRYNETRSRQHLTNRYQFHILHGERDLLVGMVPLHISFTSMPEPDKPKNLTYQLSGIQVAAYEGMTPKTAYFVSPSGGLISVTEPQEFGRWQFLLPGAYTVEVNGTNLDVTLAEGEKKTIEPAFVKVSVPEEVDLHLSSQIRGSPLFVELNNNHWLNLNEVYPVLPGNATIRLNGSARSNPIELEEGKLTERTTRSVIVHDRCAPWEWTCLGGRNILLYEKGKSYPFAEGVTDVPILFFAENVAVGVQGSRDIQYELTKDRLVSDLQLGQVKFVPEPHHRPGQATDLVRVESIQEPYIGNSLDLELERDTVMPLVAGQYYLSQYVTYNGTDGERRHTRRAIRVPPGGNVIVDFPVFVSEKKLSQLQAAEVRHKAAERKRFKKIYSHQYRPAIPLKYE